MDARRQKAHELADRAQITFADGCWSVPSQSGAGRYTVIVEDGAALCDCPDFELRGEPGKLCKHIMAVRLLIAREKRGVEQDRENREPAPKVKRKTYPQSWAEYNAAQVNEQRHFPELLADLCRTVEEPPRTGRGRRPIPLADQAFAATMKVYSLFSARRFMGELELAVERGHVRGMHFNSVLNALENPALTPVFHRLIQQSSLPLRTVETTFAPDSSGFCTSRFIRWFDVKYGVTRETAEWVKVHLMTGTKTNIVTAAAILGRDAADGPQLPGLLETTAKGFTVKEVPADKAYTSVVNYDAVDAAGGTLFAPFKTNMTGAAGGVFEKMFHYFALRREEFLAPYHQRSNVESTFSMMKRKFGDAVRSKTDTAMTNEVLAKILAHNLCRLIAAWYELGIEPVFAPVPDEPPATLPFVQRC
ncbi:MAG TPA: transposase [Gemmataceae bacterium]|nr:transposase [Gemmataceae bacterium]